MRPGRKNPKWHCRGEGGTAYWKVNEKTRCLGGRVGQKEPQGCGASGLRRSRVYGTAKALSEEAEREAEILGEAGFTGEEDKMGYRGKSKGQNGTITGVKEGAAEGRS